MDTNHAYIRHLSQSNAWISQILNVIVPSYPSTCPTHTSAHIQHGHYECVMKCVGNGRSMLENDFVVHGIRVQQM